MEYSGAGGKLIHEKNQKQKISWHCPFKEPKNRFQGIDSASLCRIVVLARQAILAGGIDSLESITGLLKLYKYGLLVNLL
jgi:hypothetical protein